MKLIRYKYNEETQIGVLENDKIFSLNIEKIDMLYGIDISTLQKSLSGILACDARVLPVIERPDQDVLCLGINYAAHAEESARFKKEAFVKRDKPIYFSKRVNRFLGDGEAIDGHFDIVNSLDYEVELAVIIGKDAKNVSKEDAADYIFGYTILNDMSARNLQTEHSQWYFGKSLDDFTPIGPVITTADEISFPPKLSIKSYVNGELRQDSNTELLINTIDEIIEELSRGITLKAGTIIATGTPAGVGMGFEPPKFLEMGDKVECEIEGIGKLTNIIKQK